MKKFKLLLVLLTALSIGLTSCKKNGEPKPDTPEQTQAKSKILGKWFITKAVFTENGQDATPAEYNEFDDTQFFNFKSDLTVDISYKVKSGTFTYTFSEDAKVLSTSSPNDTYQVKTLTDTELILLKNHTGTPKMTEEITFRK
jgi:hypothetical protein